MLSRCLKQFQLEISLDGSSVFLLNFLLSFRLKKTRTRNCRGTSTSGWVSRLLRTSQDLRQSTRSNSTTSLAAPLCSIVRSRKAKANFSRATSRMESPTFLVEWQVDSRKSKLMLPAKRDCSWSRARRTSVSARLTSRLDRWTRVTASSSTTAEKFMFGSGPKLVALRRWRPTAWQTKSETRTITDELLSTSLVSWNWKIFSEPF